MKRLVVAVFLMVGCASEKLPAADASVNGPSTDAGMPDAGSSDASTRTDDASCTQKHVACSGLQPIDVRGMSPFGPLHATGVAVSYWHGFTYGTALSVHLEIGSNKVELHVPVYDHSLEEPEAQCAPGTYRSDAPSGSGRSLSASFNLCGAHIEPQNVTLRVERHDRAAGAPLATETPVHFVGTLTLADPGWSLEVPFSLERPCRVSTSF